MFLYAIAHISYYQSNLNALFPVNIQQILDTTLRWYRYAEHTFSAHRAQHRLPPLLSNCSAITTYSVDAIKT
jgi:hypothetical protein